MSEDKAMKYCYDYLDLVELVRYYDINTYEKIFGYGGRHGHLKLMIDRKVTKLISEDLILVNTELQSKLDKAVDALIFYSNDDRYLETHEQLDWFLVNNESAIQDTGKRARKTLKELGVE